MQFHKKMLWLTTGSTIACFIAFHFIKKYSGESERGLALFFGWLFYYGLFAINGPFFLTIKDRTALFETRFLWGTILLIIWNVFMPLLAIVFA